jgi:hypothetical protein
MAAAISAERGPFRADDDLTRGAEQRVGHTGKQQRVQAVNRGKPRDLRIRHSGGEGDRCHRQTRQDVAPTGLRSIAGQLLGHRHGTGQKRLLIRRREGLAPVAAFRASGHSSVVSANASAKPNTVKSPAARWAFAPKGIAVPASATRQASRPL